MANDLPQSVQLQLAMAFGQGTGTMMASAEALEYALTQHSDVILRANADWQAAKYTFLELVRLAGQIAAVHAAHDSKAEIARIHVERAIPAVLGVCPCLTKIGR